MEAANIVWALCYMIVLVGLSLYGLHRCCIVYLFLKHRKKVPQPSSIFAQLPRVTVQLPLYNEIYVVERLLRAVSDLDYPRHLLQIQVLDDSTDETCQIAQEIVQELCANHFEVQYLHRDTRTGFKAGALQAGLDSCSGEFLLILDADFVPPRDLLKRTIHHFTDPSVGMIQTRWGHLNRSYSLLTRVQAMFLDGHLLLEQTARSRSGRFFNFNGTAGLWRRSCIQTSGGWQHDTLTEDLDLSYRAQLKGWRFVFLADLVTPAELPIDMNGFKLQQHRWTKGSIQTCKKLLPLVWKSRVPLTLKLEATAHLTSNFAYLLLIFLCVLLHPNSPGLGGGIWRTMFFDVPIFCAASLSVVVFYVCAQRELHPHTWKREILLMPLLLALGVGLSLSNGRAVLEALVNHTSDFSRTPKFGLRGNKRTWRPSRYALKTALPVVELLFGVYFTYLLITTALAGNYLSLPFIALFQIGFLYVAMNSISQWPTFLQWPWREAREPRQEIATA